LHLTFSGVRAGTYLPGTGCPDGIHYDVKGNLWAATARLGGILQIAFCRCRTAIWPRPISPSATPRTATSS